MRAIDSMYVFNHKRLDAQADKIRSGDYEQKVKPKLPRKAKKRFINQTARSEYHTQRLLITWGALDKFFIF